MKKAIIAAAVIAGTGVVGFASWRMIRMHKKPEPTPTPPPTPPSACATLMAPISTEADPGFGEITDIAAESAVIAMTNGNKVDVGSLYFAWSADAVTKKLVIDAPKTHTASDGLGTLVEAESIWYPLTGYEYAPTASLSIQPIKASFALGDGVTACVDISQQKLNVTGVNVMMKRQDGLKFPKGTILPALNLNLVVA